MVFFEIALICILGLVFGSFATALIWRIPKNISWIISSKTDSGNKNKKQAARSRCPHCEESLKVPDLIPLFSWLFLGGRCRYCQERIGCQYPLIEGATLVACLGIYFSWGFHVESFIILMTIPFLVAMTLIDIRHMILPNILNVILALTGLVFGFYMWWEGGAPRAILLSMVGGAALYGGLALLISITGRFFLKKEVLGWGDVKFFAVAGLWLGAWFLPVFLIISGTGGLLWGMGWRFFLKKKVFPFGPALIASFYVGLVCKGLNILPFI